MQNLKIQHYDFLLKKSDDEDGHYTHYSGSVGSITQNLLFSWKVSLVKGVPFKMNENVF